MSVEYRPPLLTDNMGVGSSAPAENNKNNKKPPSLSNSNYNKQRRNYIRKVAETDKNRKLATINRQINSLNRQKNRLTSNKKSEENRFQRMYG